MTKVERKLGTRSTRTLSGPNSGVIIALPMSSTGAYVMIVGVYGFMKVYIIGYYQPPRLSGGADRRKQGRKWSQGI